MTNTRAWRSARLTDVCELHSGGTPTTSEQSFWVGSTPWFSPKDLKQEYLYAAADHVSTSALEAFSLVMLPAGTVVFVVRGMILAHTFPVAVLGVPAAINQDLKALIPTAPLDTEFLAACLRVQAGHVLQQVSRSAHGTKRLDYKALERVRILLPPLELQREYSRRVERIQRLKAAQQASLRQLGSLFASLQAQAFRGEL